jgi:PAS domain-containing protein
LGNKESLTLSPIRDVSGKVAAFSTIVRDVTNEERMRAALAQRESELNDLFEEASVGLVVLSRQGRVLRANRAFLELVDRPPTRPTADAAQFSNGIPHFEKALETCIGGCECTLA